MYTHPQFFYLGFEKQIFQIVGTFKKRGKMDVILLKLVSNRITAQ